MSKDTPFAREEVMEDYLNSLLHGAEDPAEVTARTSRLLEQASAELVVSDEVTPVEPEVVETTTPAEPEVVTPPVTKVEQEPVAKRVPVSSLQALQDALEERFQALFFEVAGLTMAVPLITLGGIHRLEKVGPLIGKPKWFKGVMLHRDEKLNVVDTAQWVMPEKYDQKLANQLNYQYLIMLHDSAWGLASDKLVNTVTLNKADVKWRESSGKRPWLAGMVKERMCALVDAQQLIAMLDNGLGSNDTLVESGEPGE